jgi:hypothetical protein
MAGHRHRVLLSMTKYGRVSYHANPARRAGSAEQIPAESLQSID